MSTLDPLCKIYSADSIRKTVTNVKMKKDLVKVEYVKGKLIITSKVL